MQKLTIYDISRLAGVSVTTVSRVLNGSANVSDPVILFHDEATRAHSGGKLA